MLIVFKIILGLFAIGLVTFSFLLYTNNRYILGSFIYVASVLCAVSALVLGC